jgi:hypothetical protein
VTPSSPPTIMWRRAVQTLPSLVRLYEMEKGVHYVDIFSPTPGLAVARLMMSLAVANDMELQAQNRYRASFLTS